MLPPINLRLNRPINRPRGHPGHPLGSHQDALFRFLPVDRQEHHQHNQRLVRRDYHLVSRLGAQHHILLLGRRQSLQDNRRVDRSRFLRVTLRMCPPDNHLAVHHQIHLVNRLSTLMFIPPLDLQ